MRWHKKENIVVLTKDELNSFYKDARQNEILKTLQEKGGSFSDLANNKHFKDEIIDSAVLKLGRDNDEVEIFVVSYMLPDFYDNDYEIGFSLRDGFNLAKDPINNLADLKKAIKKNSDVDFWILTKDGFRAFQLKRYRDDITNDALFAFLSEKLVHYCNDLGYTNLLILLQTQDDHDSKIDFEDLSKKIAMLGLNFPGSILVWFNEEDKFDVIVEIYPKFRVRKLPMEQNLI